MLRCDGEPIPVTDRHASLLLFLASRAGTLISKDALVLAGWGDVAVTDNSVEKAISALRRVLGRRADGGPYIETVPRRGYRFAGEVRRVAARASPAAIEAFLAPQRVWLEGRAALETLEREQVVTAEQAFTQVLTAWPDDPPAHIGLANAGLFRFESTRVDPHPDTAALAGAQQHAHEACRLDPESAEAWAALAFVLHNAGDPTGAVTAARRAVSLETDNWRHHLRLAVVSWGEDRLRAADHTLHLLPGLALAHWLAATVHVARQAFDAAERELDAGVTAQDAQRGRPMRFGAVGLHWLRGLVRLYRGDAAAARDAFHRELTFEGAGHLYARECCANTWYALGALSARTGARDEAIRAFDETLRRVDGHLMALAAKAVLLENRDRTAIDRTIARRFVRPQNAAASVDEALAVAVQHAWEGQPDRAAAVVQDAVARATPGAEGWVIPVEPMLGVSARPDLWASVLAALRTRAA